MIDRTRKILMSIIKHCNSITETKKHFGNEYKNLKIILYIKMQF